MDLNSISSNLLLIGFALVSLCCLYLLYSNFTKVREIEELKRKVEDLKKIFFNQQQHNDETYAKMISMIQNGLSTPPLDNSSVVTLPLENFTEKQHTNDIIAKGQTTCF